ncbi:MAG: methyltransferase [Hyphomicrobiaceae bacterium]|nr:MAG: methyltransferase [Hyphomicrobiaceae bacterium]
MAQNTSNAVMQRRVEANDSLDDFPTPPWATRALCRFLIDGHYPWLKDQTVREPAANRGHMVRPLSEYFHDVIASDVHDYGVGYDVRDYLYGPPPDMVDWTITNPPFRLAHEFIERALATSRRGVAVIVRSAFLEGDKRHRELFSTTPPAYVLQLVDRCGMLKARLIKQGAPDPFNLDDQGEPRKASSATAYCWVVWMHGQHDTRFRWLSGRSELERDGDYPLYREQWEKIRPAMEGALL